MAAEPQAVKATEHEVVTPERAPGVERSPSEIGAWFAQPPRSFAGGDPPDLPGVLASADAATRVRLVGELQRRHGNAHVQRLLAARSTAPAGPAVRGAGVPGVVKASMLGRVEGLASINRERVLPMSTSIVAEVVGLVGQYAGQGQAAYDRGATDRPSAYVDTFIEACLVKAYDRGVVVTDYSNLWDDILENSSDEQAAELRRLLGGVASEYATYRPTADPDAASFLYDVADPVFFKATQLLSFGIVDKELFSESNRMIYADDYAGLMSFIGMRVGRGVVDTFTLGMGSAYLQAVWDYAEEHPNATTAELLAAGGSQALEAFLPKHEIETIYSSATGTSMAPGELPPDKWQAMEAFWTGVMKIIGIVAAAKGTRQYVAKHGVIKAPPMKGGVTGKTMHGGGKGRAGDDPTAAPARAAMNFADAVTVLKRAVGGRKWTEIMKDPSTPEAAALEAARTSFAEGVGKGLGGVRTGRIGPGHDLDITVRSNADAQTWMNRAVKELLGKDLANVPDVEGIALMQQVRDALDVNISTDAGRVTFYDARGLSRGGAVRAEEAGLRAAQIARMRILKGLADGGNPAAPSLLEIAARDTGIDPATLKPLARLPVAKAPAATRARIAELRTQIDRLAKLNDARPTDVSARRLVELQTELLTLDPDAYLYAGGIKAEVILQEPRASFTKGAGQGRLSAREAQGNIENNHLNAVNELSNAKAGTDAYVYAGGKPSFSKYVWRILRTAQKFGVEVDTNLLARSGRINTGKGKAVASELPTEAARRAYARACLAEVARVEVAFKGRMAEFARPSGPKTFTTVYDASPGAEEDVFLADDEGDLVGSIEAEVLESARPAPMAARPAGSPTPMFGRDFGRERDGASRTGAGGIVVDERTRIYESRVLPELYLQRRPELRQEILRRIREEGRRTLDVNREGSVTPATAWWDCLLNADADDYFDPVAGIMITPKETAVDREGAIVEIDNFLSIEPAFPVFVELYRAGLANDVGGRTRSPAATGRF